MPARLTYQPPKQLWQHSLPISDAPKKKRCADDDYSSGNVWGAESSDIIRGLMRELSGRSGENNNLSEQVEELTEQLKRVESQNEQSNARLVKCEELLNQIFDPSDLPPLGEFEKWLASNEAKTSYRGKRIAFVEGKGLIAAADTMQALLEEIERQGNPDGVIIGFVPAPSVLA